MTVDAREFAEQRAYDAIQETEARAMPACPLLMATGEDEEEEPTAEPTRVQSQNEILMKLKTQFAIHEANLKRSQGAG